MMVAVEAFLKTGTIFTSRPGYVWLGQGQRQWSSTPQSRMLSFYFPDFFLTTSQPWLSHSTLVEVRVEELLMQLKKSQSATLEAISWNHPDPTLFSRAFQELQIQFTSGVLQKAVPYVMATTEKKMSRERLWHALSRALQYLQDKPVCLYGTWDEKGGILGVTPERLFEVKEGVLQAAACAGTRSTTDAPEKLLQDVKELEEHRLVVKGIVDSLNDYGAPRVGKCHLLTLPWVSHLVTPIEMELPRAVKFDDLVRALHPTPALGAFPKKAGMEWLRGYQQQLKRKRYGAPVGYHNQDEACCAVAIRNVQWGESGMQIAAGCGVVAASVLEKEWQEIQIKIRAIQEMLGL